MSYILRDMNDGHTVHSFTDFNDAAAFASACIFKGRDSHVLALICMCDARGNSHLVSFV